MKSYLKQNSKLAFFLSAVPLAFYMYISQAMTCDRASLPAFLQNDVCVLLITMAVPVALSLTTAILANAVFAGLSALTMKAGDETSRYAKANSWLYALCFIFPFTYGSFFCLAMTGCSPTQASMSQHFLWAAQGYLIGAVGFGLVGLVFALLVSLAWESLKFAFKFLGQVQP